MSLTRDKVFVDSNVFVYLLGDDEKKKNIALNLLSQKPVVSVQVINENINAALKKIKLSQQKAIAHAQILMASCILKPLKKSTIITAVEILKRYGYSYYDCVIISSALENKCNILYSEDLQHHQLIQNSLKIINPFL